MAERWNELPRAHRRLIAVLAAVQVGLAVAAWTDLARRPASAVNGPKGRWALLIGVNFVGPAAWFRWGRKRVAGPS